MNNDPFGRTPDEIEDEARHSFAVGTVLLRAIADELSEIALNGDTISGVRLAVLHDQLFRVYELLGSETVFAMGDENAEPVAIFACQDTYSDGTPVSIVVAPPSSRGSSVPGNVDDCSIPWLPNTTGNEGYVEAGPIPPGCTVVVVDPPRRRMPKARGAWQDRDTDFETPKTRLRKAETRTS